MFLLDNPEPKQGAFALSLVEGASGDAVLFSAISAGYSGAACYCMAALPGI